MLIVSGDYFDVVDTEKREKTIQKFLEELLTDVININNETETCERISNILNYHLIGPQFSLL